MTKFSEIASGKIGTNKFLVVSQRDDTRYSIAQQVEALTDDQPVHIFLKNAIVVDKQGLLAIAKILQTAVAALD